MIKSFGLAIMNSKYELLVRQPYKNQLDYWELPKGQLEDFDKTYFDCAIRETLEETGVDYKDIEPFIKGDIITYTERYDGLLKNKPSRKVKKVIGIYFIMLNELFDKTNIIYHENDSVNVDWLPLNTLMLDSYRSHYTQKRIYKHIYKTIK